jgi:hypothetical protein
MKQSIIYRLMWIALCAILFSFSTVGGESFTIHLNDKLIIQHYVTSNSSAPSITINQGNVNDKLSVYYNECGRIGKERKLTVLNAEDNVLKAWSFTDAASEHSSMTCSIKDILSLKGKSGNKLKLLYSSREVSKGRLLATIVLSDNLKAKIE